MTKIPLQSKNHRRCDTVLSLLAGFSVNANSHDDLYSYDNHDHADNGHQGHANSPNHGIMKPFQIADNDKGEAKGYIELKLHDDKGDPRVVAHH